MSFTTLRVAFEHIYTGFIFFGVSHRGNMRDVKRSIGNRPTPQERGHATR